MISNKVKRIIDQLFVLSQDQLGVKNAKIVACIVHKNKIIAYGFNSKKTHPIQLNYGIQHRNVFLNKSTDEFRNKSVKFSLNLHAETNAIVNALKRIDISKLKECDMYVCRTKKSRDGKIIFGLAKPCGNELCGCSKAILDFKLKNVYYTTDEQSVLSLY